jgi:dTDP-4-amino-4,6-dideoxygalactose transaminase
MYRGLPSSSHANLPVAARTAEQVLCLPMYPDLSANTIQDVIDCVDQDC